MKKTVLYVIMCVTLMLTFAFSSVSTIAATQEEYDKTYASLLEEYGIAEKSPVQKFEITGIKKPIMFTFDESKVFSGVAARGSNITFFVYSKNAKQEWKETSKHTLTVGASGMFSQLIPYSLGENKIVVHAENSGNESVGLFMVMRKNSEIKEELKQIIVLPGESLPTFK